MTIKNPNLSRGESKYPAKINKTPRALFKAKVPKKPKAKPEWKLQAAVVSEFHKLQDAGWPFEFAGDMNAGKRNGARAKLNGLKAGEPDIRVYLPGAQLRMIEMKASGGKVSKAQEGRHRLLRNLGFDIVVIKAETEDDAVAQCRRLLTKWIKRKLH